MKVYRNALYQDDIKKVAEYDLPWEKMKDSSILISGATGLIGSFFVDVLMYRNKWFDMNCKVYAIGRNEQKAKDRFAYCFENPLFSFFSHDINLPITGKWDNIEYVLHLASNTHPKAYSTDPIGTITTNIIGVKNMLDFSVKYYAKRFAFASSNEIYGENRGDQEFFDENYCGYIDCNTMRAGYPESKRCGEALCQAYRHQKGLDIVIPRLTRSYGPTMLASDTKAISQFIKNAVQGEDIVLKSEGNQYYSYTYVADAVSGLLTVLLKGESGEAYNIADISSDIRLKDLAVILANISGKEVVFELPDAVEKAGYSKATKARLDGSKIKELGWQPLYDIKTGLERTVDILKRLQAKQIKIITEDEFIKKYGSCKDNTRNYEGYTVNKRYCLAGEKLNELISIYNTGRSFLIDAINSDKWYAKLGLTDSISILWHRHTYLLMSALLFNHCLDYFHQILWSFFDSVEWKSQKNIKKHLKKCDKETIEKSIDKLSEIYGEKKNIPHYKIIKHTQDVYASCYEMRNNLVNSLKHRGYIICDDLEPKFINAIWKNEDGSEITSNDYTTRFSLADEEEIVLECFEQITPLIDEYVKFLDSTNFFQEENGNIMIGKIKDFPGWKI